MNFEPIAAGFGLAEAPRWTGAALWFTDMAAGGVYRLVPDGTVDRWLPERRTVGGLAFDRDGRLILAGPGGLAWLDPDSGAAGVLLDRIEGEPIAGVNDIVADGRGGLIFGTVDHPAMFAGTAMAPGALWRLAPDGSVERLAQAEGFANGIGLSPDGATLYFNDSGVGTRAFALDAAGAIVGEREFAGFADCDGLAVDVEGGVWIARIGAGEVVRMMPDGTVAERHPVPGGRPTSLCFGGATLRHLYVTTAAPDGGRAVMERRDPATLAGMLLRATVPVAGLPLARTAFRLGEGRR